MMPGMAPLVSAPQLEHAFDARIDVATPCEVGLTAAGQRRVIAITGGIVDGPALRGSVLPGGADFQTIASDGLTRLHARYVIETGDGERIYVENDGLRFGSPEALSRLRRGLPVDPALIYFPHGAALRNGVAAAGVDDDDIVRRDGDAHARPGDPQRLSVCETGLRGSFRPVP